jgi:hypothetical protein
MIYDFVKLLIKLKAIQIANGPMAKEASILLNKEATTENLKEVRSFIDRYMSS